MHGQKPDVECRRVGNGENDNTNQQFEQKTIYDHPSRMSSIRDGPRLAGRIQGSMQEGMAVHYFPKEQARDRIQRQGRLSLDRNSELQCRPLYISAMCRSTRGIHVVKKHYRH